jgi:competence protein ComEA
VNHLASRSQWSAIALLAAFILVILLGRSDQRNRPLSDIPLFPVVVAVEGDVGNPGVYLFDGPRVAVGRAIDLAGGLRNGDSGMLPDDLAVQRIGNGRLIRVARSGQGDVDIRLETMPAAVRLTLGEKLSVNTSTEEDLILVPLMKSGFAAEIVNRRSDHAWRSLDDLVQIPGIGQKTIEKWKRYLDVIE